MDGATGYDVGQLEQWLAERGLKKYFATLTEHEVFSLNDLALLTSDDLVDMGIQAVGARRKLLCHSAQMTSTFSPPRRESVTSLPPIPNKRPGSGSLKCDAKRFTELVGDDDENHQDDFAETNLAQNSSVPFSQDNNLIIPMRKLSKPPTDCLPPPALKLELEDGRQQTPAQAQKPPPRASQYYGAEIAPIFQELEGEQAVLQSITDAASLLLTYEKEDSVVNEVYVPGRLNHASHNMSVDVAFFRNRMQKRIDEFMRDSTPPHSPREEARIWGADFLARGRKKGKIDYKTLIQQQAATHEQLEVVHKRYQELLQQCLDAVVEDLDKHSNVGEYRDLGEYRLKMQLAGLIGMADPTEVEQEEKGMHERLGITEATLKRRKSSHAALQEVVEKIAGDGEGLVGLKQIKEACERDPELRTKMEVLAFNLALDPENRFVADDDRLNLEVQNELETIVTRLQKDKDGLIGREEIDHMSPRVKRVLLKYGLPAVFAS